MRVLGAIRARGSGNQLRGWHSVLDSRENAVVEIEIVVIAGIDPLLRGAPDGLCAIHRLRPAPA
jgi:hypothetical protein